MRGTSSGQKKGMLRLRFVSLVVGLLLSLAGFWDSLALEDGGMVNFQRNDSILKSDQSPGDDAKKVDATGNAELRGRKMGREKVKEVKGSMRRTGANLSVHFVGRRIPKRVHFVGLMPFSSDYRRPVNHPPKNN